MDPGGPPAAQRDGNVSVPGNFHSTKFLGDSPPRVVYTATPLFPTPGYGYEHVDRSLTVFFPVNTPLHSRLWHTSRRFHSFRDLFFSRPLLSALSSSSLFLSLVIIVPRRDFGGKLRSSRNCNRILSFYPPPPFFFFLLLR